MIKIFIRWILPTKIRIFTADYVYKILAVIRYQWSLQIILGLQMKSNQVQNKRLSHYLKKPLLLLEKFELRHIEKLDKNINFFDSIIPSSEKREGILLMIGSLGPGGAERQAVLTLSELKKNPFICLSCCIFCLESPSQRFRLPVLIEKGIEYTPLDQNFRKKLQYPYFKKLEAILPSKLYYVLDCISFLISKKPKILHLWLDDVNVNAGIAAIIVGVPRIILNTRNVSPDAFTFYRLYMREWYRWLAQKKNVVMTNNSYAGAQSYEKWLNLPKGTVQVVYNGFDFNDKKIEEAKQFSQETRQSLGIAAGIPLIGTVIRLSEEKQPLLWLEVAAKILEKMPQARFLIVGDGLMKETVKKHIIKLGLNHCIHLPGLYREPLKVMAAMDIFLLTSRVEGLPNVLIESQAVGTPVVTTDAGGAKETLLHKETGWVVEKNSPDYIAAKVIELLSSSDWLIQAKKNGPKFVENKFSVDQMMTKTMSIYN